MTESWTRLSVRRGVAESDGPYEGVPPHLQHSVGEWLRRPSLTPRFGVTNLMRNNA